MTTWILCPNLWGARLFRYGSANEPSDQLKFIREFPRPKTQTKLEDLPTEDEAPEITPPPESPAKELRVARTFMHLISNELEKACIQGRFDSLILCAESQLLEILNHQLGPQSRKRLIGSVDIDLYEANETDLVSYVRDILAKKQKRVVA